jgi:hypothetical protein
VSKRIALIAAAGVAVATLAAQAAGAAPSRHATVKKAASSRMLIGINDEAYTLYGDPATAFQVLRSLRVQVLRVNLYWGGTQWAVANKKPTDPTDPGDPAYDWSLYDRLARYAHTYQVQLMFSIVGTPRWANGGKARTVPPTNMNNLRAFATAAATRYDGAYVPPSWQQLPDLEQPTEPLPTVNYWTAWNEPNNPVFLTPQYKRVRGKWTAWSAVQYAKICNAVYAGVHAVSLPFGGVVNTPGPPTRPSELVACGVTDPRGNDNAGSSRASIDPLSFLIAAHAAGMKTFDVYAHNPYASSGAEPPTYVPKGKTARRIQLGNINTLLRLISKYYGPKHLWITEYGYQTDPPKKTLYGTSWKNQAAWLKQAALIARRNPRIDMFLWYLVKDEPQLNGWQSGLMTASGQKKPAWNAFLSLPRG